MKKQSILTQWIFWMLAMIPVTVLLSVLYPERQVLIFTSACLAIIPLAGWLGRATEHLSEHAGEGVGGLLNATFGNAAELIIAGVALSKGLTEVVKASLTGSIIGNILLILGLSFFLGGVKHRTQHFNAQGAGFQCSMMTLALIALVMPAAFHHLAGASAVLVEKDLSLDISLVLISTYAASLVFSLWTHKELFSGEKKDDLQEMEDQHEKWSIGKSVFVLIVSTVFIAWMSEILVGSVEAAAHTLGMNSIFVGVIVVAIVGNAAEHSTALIFAAKNRMDLALGIAYGSSVQIALFVAPLLVLLSYFLAPVPMDLVFTPFEVLAIGMSVLIAGQVSGDGRSNWLEGVQLLGVYVIMGMVFYFMPV